MLALREAGIENRAVCLHSSLRSHGHVDGGATTVVDAFLDAGATLLVPTFGGSRYAVTAPPDLRPPRNGISYDGWTDQGGLPVDPAAACFAGREFTTSDNDTLMGAIPAEVLTRPGRQGPRRAPARGLTGGSALRERHCATLARPVRHRRSGAGSVRAYWHGGLPGAEQGQLG